MDRQDELFVVVNEHDKILGYWTRYDCHHDKNLIHRDTGIIIFNKKGQILFQKRSSTKDTDPGLYSISVSGSVSKGETYRQAVERELFEELGIRTKLKFSKKFLVKTENEMEMNTIFIGKHNGPFKINKNELDEVRFFLTTQIKKNITKDVSLRSRMFKKNEYCLRKSQF
jgi:isopentenyl-diphosphate delta-isomerase type 1